MKLSNVPSFEEKRICCYKFFVQIGLDRGCCIFPITSATLLMSTEGLPLRGLLSLSFVQIRNTHVLNHKPYPTVHYLRFVVFCLNHLTMQILTVFCCSYIKPGHMELSGVGFGVLAETIPRSQIS